MLALSEVHDLYIDLHGVENYKEMHCEPLSSLCYPIIYCWLFLYTS